MSGRKRVALWVVVLVALAGVGWLGVLWTTAPTHRITLANLEKVERARSEAEVEAIFGVPAGDYSGGRTRVQGGVSYPGGINKKWIAEDCAYEIAFAPDGHVGGISVTDNRPPSLLDRLRRWVGL